MTDNNFDKDFVSNSKFYMLRCLITMAHADDVLTDVERSYMEAFMLRLPLTDEQKSTLEDDLTSPAPIEDLLPNINEPSYRSQVLYFARLMAFKDGNLEPTETDLLNKIKAMTTDGLDIEALKKEAKIAAEYDMNQLEIDVDSMRPHKGWFYIIDRIFLVMGIDLMRD